VHCVTRFVGVIKGDYMWIADNRAGPRARFLRTAPQPSITSAKKYNRCKVL